MKTTSHQTLSIEQQSLLKELQDFLLALCWVLNRHSDKITLIKGNKTRICFRSFLHPIGFTKNEENSKSTPCSTPVILYLFLFLKGIIIPWGHNRFLVIRNLFFQGLSQELQIFLSNDEFMDSPIWDLFLKNLNKQGPLSHFKEAKLSKLDIKYCHPNDMHIVKIQMYLSQKGREPWIYVLAQNVFEANRAFQDYNPNLNLGLVNVPFKGMD